jgi:hypothetical protein
MKKIIFAITAFVLASGFMTTAAHAGYCTVTSFTANDYSIAYGASTTVTWNSSGCDTISITPAANPGNRPPAASAGTGKLYQTTTFTATGYDVNGNAGGSRTLTISVDEPDNGGNNGGNNGGGSTWQQCTINSFSAAETLVDRGDGTVLHWDTDGCDSVAIHPADYPGDRPPYGSISTGAIFNSTEYTLTAYDAQGNIGGQRFVTVNVRTTSTNTYACNDGVDNDGDGYVDMNDPGCSSPTDNSEVNTTQTYACNDGRDNDGDGYIDMYDPGCSSPTDDNESNGSNNNDECEIDRFVADDYSIREGDSVRLEWETSDCESIDITPDRDIKDAYGSVDDGYATARPRDTVTYTLHAYPGNDTAKVTIHVDEDDDDDNDNDYCEIDSFTADSYSITSNQSTTLRWRTTGADDVDITPGYNNQSEDGSRTVSPNSTTTYTIHIDGDNCSDSKSLTVYVSNNGSSNNSQPQAITTAAINFGAGSAQLNGIAIPNTSSGSTTAWFEWGPGTSLGSRTDAKTINSNGSTNYSDMVYGLQPNVAYYYRAVVQNKNGIAYGDIVRIPVSTAVVQGTSTTTTSRSTVSTGRAQQQTVVVANSVPSLLELKVASMYDRMCVGGDMDYTVTYHNLSNTRLDDTVLQITLPKELDYVGGSRGNYDSGTRVVTIDLGTVQGGEEGSVTIRARVTSQAAEGKLAVMTATVVYTNSVTRAQESAIAYSLITVSPDCPNLLGASVYGFGSFLPHTLLEWLLLILVILALVILGRNLYKKKEVPKA